MIHKRLAAKTARASTAVLFNNWRAIACPIEAYKLVQKFVVAASRYVLNYTDASAHVRSDSAKRSETPEISDAGSKRQKTVAEIVMIDDDPALDSEKRQKTVTDVIMIDDDPPASDSDQTEVAAAWNDLSRTWSCGACTFVNDKPLAPVCAICGSNRAGTEVAPTIMSLKL